MPRPAFDAAAFQRSLNTRAIGRWMVYREECESTMPLARREAEEGAPHGTIVLAEAQTAGRGRRGRSFHSPAGENLYFTLVLRLSQGQHRVLPVALPLAVADAVRAEGIDARIKWPNDIWVGERKLCGMLIDAEAGPGGLLAFPGIGVNVNGDPTLIPELAGIATSVRRELGHAIAREPLLARLCDALETNLAQPFAELVPGYRALSLVLGREVVVSPAAGDPFAAHAEDVTADGALVVRREDGRHETVAAADVSVRPR
ncbi:MAG: biotin--[acetyl-CoA-carboxylase] ligase [Dehalococcoidia bacterium]|nr:biotin--[acetyl-CoA-carboxylase] ligase [Dehalococcoidia bacterium]